MKMVIMMSLIVFVGLLCAFLAEIPPTHSIKCYQMFNRNGNITDDGLVNCTGEGYKRCGTLNYATGSGEVFEVKNCRTRSLRDCNHGYVCRMIRRVVERKGDTFSECSSSCCEGDECNGPAKKKRSLVKLHGKKKDSKVVKSFNENLFKRIASHHQ